MGHGQLHVLRVSQASVLTMGCVRVCILVSVWVCVCGGVFVSVCVTELLAGHSELSIGKYTEKSVVDIIFLSSPHAVAGGGRWMWG